MEAKLSISDIEYIYTLAAHKTDEELAALIKKPVALVQMQFSLMSGLPIRPWEKVVLPAVQVVSSATNDKHVVKGKKPSALRPLKLGKKKKKALTKKKEVAKKKTPAKEEKKLISAHAQALERQKIRNTRNNQSVYATRPLDLNGKIHVKLNAKTDVWVAPGTNIEELKKKLNIA